MPYGPADAVDPGTLKRALVIKLRHHGDVLLASPVFSVLKNRAPQLEIDALVYADTRDMLSLHPAIAQVHGVERGRKIARALGPRIAVAPDHPDKPRFWKRSFTHRYALPKNARRHMVELNLDALRRIGIQPGDGERALVLVPGTEAERSVEATLAGHGLAARGYLLFHPGSRWQFKCWPADKAAALLDELARRGERVVISGAPDARERELVADILARTHHARPIDLSGKPALTELAALTARRAPSGRAARRDRSAWRGECARGCPRPARAPSHR